MFLLTKGHQNLKKKISRGNNSSYILYTFQGQATNVAETKLWIVDWQVLQVFFSVNYFLGDGKIWLEYYLYYSYMCIWFWKCSESLVFLGVFFFSFELQSKWCRWWITTTIFVYRKHFMKTIFNIKFLFNMWQVSWNRL